MASFSVNVLQIRDSSFNIGFKMGNFIQNKPILKTLELITKPEIDFKNMRSIYSTFAPHLLEELEGLSQGLEIPLNRAASLFSGYDLPRTEAMGCSAIITTDYYVRNYDFSPTLYDGIFSLVQPDTAFATAGYNLQLIGRHDGVNQEGLVAGLHFVSNNDYTRGVSPWTSIRMVLDIFSTTDDAINMLKEIPHSACYNFSLGDKKGNIAEVEASPGKVIVRRGESLLSCVNHFQTDMLKNKNRTSIEGSVHRNNYLLGFKDKNMTHSEMFDNFNDTTSPVFFTDYDNFFGTLHTFSYSYKDSRILTAIARSNQVLDINFQEWLEGETINDPILQGIIEEGS
ncbi:C45 family autoproteolytic acyltransferase/hydrolase [Virgibacillus sp. C22-A2]|uniref:C45 family autoproteolytic acyltransferase/hydrolase n=1 Tax=Virgibacillus tibetensis TaxID=3042313 RepID=A0ABU6KHG3_9BACI|nr:C45 family autoproteolytic acyltransferase/hydrolase [Virgibacillus sp. C22-A2]